MSQSEKLYAQAKEQIPGGVNSLFVLLMVLVEPHYLLKKRMALIFMTLTVKPMWITLAHGDRWY